MPVKENPDTLSYPQLEAFSHHEIKGLSTEKAGEIVGVCGKTIDNWKKKPAWHELAVAAIQEEEKGLALKRYAEKLIAMADKQKKINVGGKLEEVDDNVAQIAYLERLAKTFGLDAPAKTQHSLVAETPDDELASSIEQAEQEYQLGKRPAEPPNDAGHSDSQQGRIL